MQTGNFFVMSKAKTPYPSDKHDQFMVRMPDGLRDRIKAAADANNRSMNAEVVATLVERYPPKALDIAALADFLDTISGAEEDEEFDSAVEMINDMLSYSPQPFTMRASGDGTITFYPYATPRPFKSDSSE